MVYKARPPTKTHLLLFQKELWKEQRLLCHIQDKPGSARLRKHFRSAQQVESELYHLNMVRSELGPNSVPRVLHATDQYVDLEYIEGTRIHNILEVLAGLEKCRPAANQARQLIINRCAVISARVQNALIHGVEKRHRDHNSYPIRKKLDILFTLFDHCLKLDLDLSTLKAEADFAENYVNGLDCPVPFRDAAPKNFIMQWPQAWLGRLSAKEQHKLIGDELRNFEQGRETRFGSCPIVNIDFSSCDELTVPEDDPISLLFHESCWLGTLPSSDELLWQPLVPNPTRLAIGLIVRLYRLGGRRLSYYLVHKEGYKARYADESITFYFKLLLRAISELCPTATHHFPSILKATQGILTRLSQEVHVTEDWFMQKCEVKLGRYYRDIFPY